MTRLPANDFIFPTAVVERSPKFFSCDAAAFILALVGKERGRRRRRGGEKKKKREKGIKSRR